MSVSAIRNVMNDGLVERSFSTEKTSSAALSEVFTSFECKDPDCQLEFEPSLIASRESFQEKRSLLRAVFSCPNCGTWYSVPLFDLGFVANIDAVILGEIGIHRRTLKIAAR